MFQTRNFGRGDLRFVCSLCLNLVQTPDEKQRREVLEHLIVEIPCTADVSVRELATLSASLSRRDLETLVTQAGINAIARLESSKRYFGITSEQVLINY